MSAVTVTLGTGEMARGGGEDGPHPVDRHVGRRVCEKRISLGYNQTELGRALGLTFQQIQKYEKGTNRISSSKLYEIANFFKVDIAYFFEGLRSQLQPGVAEDDAPAFEHDFPSTRYTIELGRIAPSLPPVKQKLLLEMARALKGAEDEAEDA